MGLNGSGVIVGVADSRIDADRHAFETLRVQRARPRKGPTPPTLRSACLAMTIGKSSTSTAVWTGTTPLVTAIIGTEPMSSGPLRVWRSQRAPGAYPGNGSTTAHTGPNWSFKTSSHPTDGVPPSVDALLWESSAHRGVIHSNSWGDDTTAYTERTGRFDAYPLEPFPGRWPSCFPATATREGVELRQRAKRRRRQCEHQIARCRTLGFHCVRYTEASLGRYFRARPGGQHSLRWRRRVLGHEQRKSSYLVRKQHALPALQARLPSWQLYRMRWITHENGVLTNRYLSDIKPAWAEPAPLFRGVELGEGSPSGSLLRASLTLATTPLPETVPRRRGTGGHDLHNPYDGWGVLNLSQLMDPSAAPEVDVWIRQLPVG